MKTLATTKTVSSLSLKEKAQSIRKQLKTLGYTSKQVSIRTKIVLYDDSITATIKDLHVPFKVVNDIVSSFESIRRDEACDEILAGCNTYTHTELDHNVVRTEREQYIQYSKDMISKYKDTPVGQLESIAKNGDLEIFYTPKNYNCNGEAISIYKNTIRKYEDGEEYTGLDRVENWTAHNGFAIAEALVYFVNQYGFKIAA